MTHIYPAVAAAAFKGEINIHCMILTVSCHPNYVIYIPMGCVYTYMRWNIEVYAYQHLRVAAQPIGFYPDSDRFITQKT